MSWNIAKMRHGLGVDHIWLPFFTRSIAKILGLRNAYLLKPLGVPLNMLAHKSRDEIIGVIIAFLHPYLNIQTGRLANFHQPSCFELFIQKVVRGSLID